MIDDLQMQFDAQVAEMRRIRSEQENPRLLDEEIRNLEFEHDKLQSDLDAYTARVKQQMECMADRVLALMARRDNLKELYLAAQTKRDEIEIRMQCRSGRQIVEKKQTRLEDLKAQAAALQLKIEQEEKSTRKGKE